VKPSGRQILRSLDHLVGDSEQRRRYDKIQHARGLHIDPQFELARLHDWQIRGLRAFPLGRDPRFDLHCVTSVCLLTGPGSPLRFTPPPSSRRWRRARRGPDRRPGGRRRWRSLLHEDDLSSQSNEFEARMVASLIWCLRQCASKELDGRLQAAHAAPSATEFWSTIVGIVTPHRAQRAAVIRELRRLFPNDSPLEIAKAVDTVEKFQGDERHVIIVSFAVGDPDVIAGEEAFLMQLERTNVAISRAMAKCIVTMPSSLAGHIPEDRKALETAHALKGYVDEFCNRSVAITITGANVTRNGQLRWRA
jgi:hypothetical protein